LRLVHLVSIGSDPPRGGQVPRTSILIFGFVAPVFPISLSLLSLLIVAIRVVQRVRSIRSLSQRTFVLDFSVPPRTDLNEAFKGRNWWVSLPKLPSCPVEAHSPVPLSHLNRKVEYHHPKLVANIPANELETKCRDKLSWNWYVVNGTGLDRSVVLVKSYLLQSNQINHPRNNPGRGRTYDSTCDA
jgi:hypothetical protein